MPKTKFQNVVFTLMMAFLMVYAMICYNIFLNIGGMNNQIFLMAFHEMVIMWPIAFILEFFVVDNLGSQARFPHGNAAGSPDRYHAGYLCHDYLHHVSGHESDCNPAVQKRRVSVYCCLAADHFHEFPGGFLLAADVLQTVYPTDFPENVPGEISDIEWDSKGFSPCIK